MGCAVHVIEPKSGKRNTFNAVGWGVR